MSVQTDFWPTVWRVLDHLDQNPDSDRIDRQLLGILREDLAVQRTIFIDRGWAHTEWFSTLRQEGLFSNPPPVEKQGDTTRATAWPALDYLKEVASDLPEEASEILTGIDSENWWVVSDGLEVANSLPSEHAAPAILHLIELWQALSFQWTHPDVLVSAVQKLAADQDTGRRADECLARIMWKLMGQRGQQRFDLEEVIKAAMNESSSPNLRFYLANAIEHAVLSLSLSRSGFIASWTRLIDMEADVHDLDDGIDLAIRSWLEIIEAENKSEGSSGTLIRATRLLSSSHSLPRQLGLRALSLVLDQRTHDAEARGVLESLLTNEDLLSEPSTLGEAKAILQKHWSSLLLETQADVLERLIQMGRSALQDPGEVERSKEALVAHEWLHWLQHHLGPRERTLLSELNSRLGPRRDDVERSFSTVGFVGSKGPVEDEVIRRWPVSEIVTLMRAPPGPGPDEWHIGPSAEGLGMQVRALLSERLEEFLVHLPEIASQVQFGSILYQVILGLTDAFKEEAQRTDKNLDEVLRFLNEIARRAADRRIADEEFYRSSSVLGAAADFFRDYSSWVSRSLDNRTLEVLKIALRDPNPELERSEDPVSTALNSTRGKALLAALELLSKFWGTESIPSTEAKEELEGLLKDAVASEQNPGVRSALGLYLPSLIFYWPEFWHENHEQVLPTSDERSPQWEAVFASYLVHNHPHMKVAPGLHPHYSLAASRLAETFPVLNKFASHLVSHLLAISLVDQSWLDLAAASLARADDEAASRGISALVRPKKAGTDDIPQEWVVDLIRLRLAGLRVGQQKRPQELRALAELLVATNLGPTSIGGAFIDLLKWGGLPRGDELVDYLRRTDPNRTNLGGQILGAAVKGGTFDTYLRQEKRLPELISEYAATSPSEMWDVVNHLGRFTRIPVEEVAHDLFRTLAGPATR